MGGHILAPPASFGDHRPDICSSLNCGRASKLLRDMSSGAGGVNLDPVRAVLHLSPDFLDHFIDGVRHGTQLGNALIDLRSQTGVVQVTAGDGQSPGGDDEARG